MFSIRARRMLASASAAALVAAGLVLGTATAASAASVAVPADQPTIQAAVTAAADGDTINVAAGTYTENVIVPSGKSLTITGAGAATTTITGRVTLNSPTTVSGFTVQGQATAPYTQDPFWITSTGAGSVIENNTIQNGLRGLYISGAVGTDSAHTVVRGNTILETGFGQTGAVWIANSLYVDVIDNTFTNTTADGVGVNLVGGSSNIVITGNSFTNFGNALVLIANSIGFPATPQAHDIQFSDNTITDSTATALYIGGNNIIDVTITGNTVTTIAGGTTAAILFTPGYSGNPTAWLEPGNLPLERFLIQGNDFDDMAYGVVVADGVQLDNATTVQIVKNKFCTVDVAAIDNRDTSESLLAVDNDFCNADVLGDVVVQNTPVLANTGSEGATELGLLAGGTVLFGALILLLARRRTQSRRLSVR